jgi:fucose permease
MRRDAVTWYCYLLLGFLNFALTIQGNVLPFLMSGLGLSYGTASLHSSAIAAGMIVVGLAGDRLARRLGRGLGMRLATFGVILGLLLVAFGPVVSLTLAGCLLIGVPGALIPAVGFAVLADVQGPYRDVAYNESNAVCYAFAISAPLSMSACLWLAIPWWFSLLFDAAIGLALMFAFAGVHLPAPANANRAGSGALPITYWAYWCSLALAVAIEFCVVIWAPTFLGRSVGLTPSTAAGAAAAFSVAMVVGRGAVSRLVRRWPVERLFVLGLAIASAGFALYWGATDPTLAVAGLFVIGLGVAPLYPLALGLAIGAAADQGDAASARVMIAVGLAILLMPAALGRLADAVGLRTALLMVPALILVSVACFIAAELLQRRAGLRAADRAP